MTLVREVPWPRFDPIAFFRRCDEREVGLSFVRQGSWTIIAWQPSLTIIGNAQEDIVRIQTLIRMKTPPRTSCSNVPFVSGIIGCIGYDLSCHLRGMTVRPRKGDGFPGVLAHDYRHAIITDGRRTFISGGDAFLKDAESIRRRPARAISLSNMKWESDLTISAYRRLFRSVKDAINQGSVYQLNLTYAWRTRSSNDRRRLFSLLLARHPAEYGAYIEAENYALLSLSPERFLAVDAQGRIETRPVKGTAPRGRNETEDAQHMRTLSHDGKERAELAMITDLLRNDLGLISEIGSVRVAEERRIFSTPSVWHAYSRITSQLASGMTAFDALCECLPGGSITGCPKRSAIEHIDRLERYRRGAYTGTVFTLADDGVLGSSIVIRALSARGKALTLGVGGGIVTDSLVDAEWQETLAKAAPFLAPLEDAECLWMDGAWVTISRMHRSMLDAKNADMKGIFETMYAYAGEVRLIENHMRRLRRSATLTHLSLPLSLPRIRSAVTGIAARFSSPAKIKIVATKKHVLVYGSPLMATHEHTKTGIAAQTISLERHMPAAKSLPNDACARAREQANRQGFGEALLVDGNGHVTEGAYSNVFWVKSGVLHTTSKNILLGIARGEILSLAKSLGIIIAFDSVTTADLCEADECFVTNAITGIVPVVRINAARMGTGRIGRITRMLMRAHNEIQKNGNARGISI